MKSILTLLFTVSFLVTAVAQKPREHYDGDNRSGRYNERYDDRRFDRRNQSMLENNMRERDRGVARINFRYNQMIRDIYADRYMRNSQKRWQIQRLERDRDQQIQEVLSRYNYRRNNNAYDYSRF